MASYHFPCTLVTTGLQRLLRVPPEQVEICAVKTEPITPKSLEDLHPENSTALNSTHYKPTDEFS